VCNPSLRIEKLQRTHAVESFDYGKEPLNRFLIRYALQNQQAGASQSYLAFSGDKPIGYYTLVVGQVEYADAPERLTKGPARHPMSLMLLARLAIAQEWRGKGTGSGLLKDAMLRTLQAAEIAGIGAFAVHARDDQARAFYERSDLIPSPADPYHLFILLNDVRSALR
jgi:GNAT superfamily N-acetyltransferase